VKNTPEAASALFRCGVSILVQESAQNLGKDLILGKDDEDQF
jgi:hypothetical protein